MNLTIPAWEVQWKHALLSIFWDKEDRPELLVMAGLEVLGEVVAEVFTSGLPVDEELKLFDTIYNSIESHVYRLGILLLDCIIFNSGSTLVVCLNGCRGLGMTKLT